ncbi:MLP-like protein 43 [Tanacetum coccineum]
MVAINPEKVHDCDYMKGKKEFSKQINEAVDEGKAPDLCFKGDGKVATWTFEFENPDTSVPYPTSLMGYLCNVVKDLDAHNSS